MILFHCLHRVGKVLAHLLAILHFLLVVHLKNELTGGRRRFDVVVVGQIAEHIQFAAGRALQKLA